MPPKNYNEILSLIIDEYDADIFIYAAEIVFNAANNIIDQIQNAENKRKNCVLILTTYGGDPDAAYRIIKLIKRYYSEIILFVFGPCKSAGTLMALGADKIKMGLLGEFGPLDIQLTKDDEFVTNTSGVSYLNMLNILSDKLFIAFENSFLNLKQRSRYSITTKTAGDICSSLAVGLVSPISAQIDPLKLGDIQRAINITYAYGQRLGASKELLDKLILHYPSHGFVIDIEEAVTLFNNVESPSVTELELEQLIKNYVRFVPDQPITLQLKPEKTENDTAQPKEQQHEGNIPDSFVGNGESVKIKHKEVEENPSVAEQ